MKQIETSVIIPVYNEEKYIIECYNAIINTEYNTYEIIVVDDGSTDNTPQILNDLAASDKRLVILQQSNAGPAAARNLGLSKASGEYIVFVDADDIMSENAILIMLDSIKSANADFLFCDAKRITINGNENNKYWGEKSGYYEEEDLIKVFEKILENERDNRIFASVWGKVYKKSLLDRHNIRFEEAARTHEDELFTFEYMLKIRSMYYLHDFLYTYYRNKNNFGSSYAPKTFDNIKKLCNTLNDGLKNKIDARIIKNYYCDQIISECYHLVRNYKINKLKDIITICRRLKQFINDEETRENIKYYLNNNADNFKCIPFFVKHKLSTLLFLAFKLQVYLQKHNRR